MPFIDAPGLDLDAGREELPGERGSAWSARLAQGGAWGALAERWVPEPLREARIDPGRRGAVLLCTVAALAALVAAVGVWLARPTPAPVGAPQAGAAAGNLSSGSAEPGTLAAVAVAGSTGTSGVPDGDSAGGVASPEAESGANSRAGIDVAATDVPAGVDGVPAGPILVSVTGKVRKPGLVSVPADARVADAIEAAGGVADLALLAGMNLAAHLTDGASVVVGGPDGNSVAAEAVDDPDGGAATSAGTGPALIDINTADSATLQQLSGVGPVTAEAIIAYRTQHGPFTELSQLQEVSGIGPATYARLAPHVTL